MGPTTDAGGLELSCAGINAEGVFLRRHTGRGADESPEFRVSGIDPSGASFAIVLEDLTHPLFGTMAHWLAWNVPAEEVVPAGIAPGKHDPHTGIVQGVGYGVHRYRGPKPPQGRTHEYRFSLFVLNRQIDLAPRARLKRLLATMEPFVVQRGAITGRFE